MKNTDSTTAVHTLNKYLNVLLCKSLLHSCVSVSTSAALSLIEFLNNDKLCLLMTRYHHLRNTLAVVHDKLLLRQVDKADAHLTAIVGINGTWRVDDSSVF